MKTLLILSLIIPLFQLHASNLNQFFSGSSTSSLSGSVIFRFDETWVVPTGVTKINVEIIGAGGGGPNGMGYSGGGGGGGSCIKSGSTVLASANGGRGAHYSEEQAQPGGVTRATLTVSPGSTLSIFTGGGGGGAGYYSGYLGGAGGYGPCGIGGAGGDARSAVGGTGGADKGGGGGGGNSTAGGNASSSTGGTAGAATAYGGTALVGGAPSFGAGGGGASGGVGGAGGYYEQSFRGTSGKYGTNVVTAISNSGGISITVEPGSPGSIFHSMGSIGGGGGLVKISW